MLSKSNICFWPGKFFPQSRLVTFWIYFLCLCYQCAHCLQWQELSRAGCFQHLLSHWDGAHLIRIASSGRLATALATAQAAAAAEDGIPALKQVLWLLVLQLGCEKLVSKVKIQNKILNHCFCDSKSSQRCWKKLAHEEKSASLPKFQQDRWLAVLESMSIENIVTPSLATCVVRNWCQKWTRHLLPKIPNLLVIALEKPAQKARQRKSGRTGGTGRTSRTRGITQLQHGSD